MKKRCHVRVDATRILTRQCRHAATGERRLVGNTGVREVPICTRNQHARMIMAYTGVELQEYMETT